MKRTFKATPPIMLLMKDMRLLEHDAQTQYRFNRFWAILWGFTILIIPFIPAAYAHSVSALIIQEISLWANFATHFGAMSAALAAENTTRAATDVTKEIVDISSDVDDIHEHIVTQTTRVS